MYLFTTLGQLVHPMIPVSAPPVGHLSLRIDITLYYSILLYLFITRGLLVPPMIPVSAPPNGRLSSTSVQKPSPVPQNPNLGKKTILVN